jgi:hypothetical protein
LHKFLGVIIDQNLNFKEHAAYAMAKGTTYMMTCLRIIRPTRGIHGKLVKRLFESVVLPQMLYAADIWCAGLIAKGRGRKGGGRGARGFASQMARVQRMATLLITGGLRSTATDVLDTHANVLPFQQALRKIQDQDTISSTHSTTTCESLQSIDHTIPSRKFASRIADLPREHGTLIFQLRTGHVALNKYLHRIGKAPSAKCQECNTYEETVHHFLLVCPRFARQRNALSLEIGPRQLHVKYLLSEIKGIKATLKYIARTKRMEQIFGDVTPPKEKE